MIASLALLAASTLTVGDGKSFSRIEDALAAAHPGDRIEVYPKSAGYGHTALRVTVPDISIVAKGHVLLDGAGFDYSGSGRVPRAIVQIDSDGATVEGFELANAHNESFNGAGVRINAGRHATVRNCTIHDNDMGIMSNGREGDVHAAEDQLIEGCDIYRNGNLKDPGYNHNLYLGGTSVTLRRCEIYASLTGHNLKSRAHFNRVEYCFIHDSANRECDFVEAWDTERPHSNALLLGNHIQKDPQCKGNRSVIHFGREKGKRDGTIFLVNDTIVTPFYAPVVSLSAPTASAVFVNDVIFNDRESHPRLVEGSSGALLSAVSGRSNWISSGYDLAGTRVEAASRWSQGSPFAPGGLLKPGLGSPSAATYEDGTGVRHPAVPEFRYVWGGAWKPTSDRFLGAG